MRTLTNPLHFALICAAGLVLSGTSLAQSPDAFGPAFGTAAEPALVLNLSPSGIRALNDEFDEDLRALDAFAGARRKRTFVPVYEPPKSWTLYGRAGVLNFHNEIRDDRTASGTRFSLRRSGPKLTGKVYIGIHRRF